MAKLDVMPQSWGVRYLFHCEGCGCGHSFAVRTDGGRPSWTFDGDRESPTFSPSLLTRGVRPITDDERDRLLRGESVAPEPFACHLFLRDGVIEYLGDCTHRLAGQSVPLTDLDNP